MSVVFQKAITLINRYVYDSNKNIGPVQLAHICVFVFSYFTIKLIKTQEKRLTYICISLFYGYNKLLLPFNIILYIFTIADLTQVSQFYKKIILIILFIYY